MSIRIFYHEQKKFKQLEKHDLKILKLSNAIKQLEDNLKYTSKTKNIQKYEKQLNLEKQKLFEYLESVKITHNQDQDDYSVFHTTKEIYE